LQRFRAELLRVHVKKMRQNKEQGLGSGSIKFIARNGNVSAADSFGLRAEGACGAEDRAVCHAIAGGSRMEAFAVA
jgi:hypothetical protein